MPNPFGRWSLPNLLFHHGAPIQPQDNQGDHGLGRYSLPSVLGRMFNHGYTPGPLSQEGPLSSPGFQPGQFGLNSPFTNPSVNQGLPPGYQTIAVNPYQTVDPNSLHVTPITDVRVGNGGGGGQAGAGPSVGMTYNKLMGDGARSGWGTTRGPNYS